MAHKLHLTLDEEFRLYTATLMNNWFALKLLIAHSEDSVQIRNSKVEELFELLIKSIQEITCSNIDLMDCVDRLEDYIDLKFNTYIEDNSCEEVLNELLSYYNLLLNNNREELSSAINHLKERRSIFSNEEYTPNLERKDPKCPKSWTKSIKAIVRVSTPHQSTHRSVYPKNLVSVEDTAEMPLSALTTEPNAQPDCEWETVTYRRTKNK